MAGALVCLVAAGFVVLPQLFGNGVAVTPAAPPQISSPSASTLGLLEADDLRRAGLHLAGGRQWRDGTQRLTGCTGRESMVGLTRGRSGQDYASALWRTPTAGSGTLRESLSRTTTRKAAESYNSSLINELRGCLYRQHGGPRHLDRPATVHTDAGRAVRFVAYDSQGRPVGGVGVFQKGTTFGVLDLACSHSGHPDEVLDSLSAAAVRRIT